MSQRAATCTHPEPAPEKRYAPVPVGADYLSVSVPTMWRAIRSGRVRAYRFGPRIVRVDLGELDQLMTGGDGHA